MTKSVKDATTEDELDADRGTETDPLLRELAAAPSIEIPSDLATMVLLAPGTIVDGKFEIVERLGAGGMGVVYAAKDLVLGRKVAVKLMRLERGVGAMAPGWRKLPEVFEREARATARLNHPNIVTLHQFGDWNGILYLVLERLRGEPLSARLERGPVPLVDALAVIEQVANALVHTHAAGIVHRDLKPQNVFLLADGGVKVLDFGVSGLSLVASAAVSGSMSAAGAEASSSVTMAHAGTPGYMAPEQWTGESQDARTDLWALGVMLYELVVGTLPFGTEAPRTPANLDAFADRLPKSASELVPLVHRCLELRREAREADAARVAHGIRTIREALDPTLARAVQPHSLASRLVRRGLGAGAAIAIGVAIATTVGGDARSRCDDAEHQLAGVWDPTVRARFESRFAAFGSTRASTWSVLAGLLDRYAGEWVALRERACRNDRKPTLQCLDDRRAQLARFVDEHADMQATETAAAVEAARALPGIADCADPDYLARMATASQPSRAREGFVRAALAIGGAGRDSVHEAIAVGDDFLVAGVTSSAGAQFGRSAIPAYGGFVARVGADDKLRWVEQSNGKVVGIASHGNQLFVAGHYWAATALGGKSLPKPATREDCFVGSLDAQTGEAHWLIPCGATANATSRAAEVDRDGNLYVAGYFGGTARFGGDREIAAEANPNRVPFVASWTPMGALRWVTAGRRVNSGNTKALAVDGDTVVVGMALTGGGTFGDRTVARGGCAVATLDRSDGRVRWFHELGLPECTVESVALTGGRIAAVGSLGMRGMFVAELDAATAAVRWQHHLGSDGSETVRGAMYRDGILSIVGRYGNTTMKLGDEVIPNRGAMDAFLAGFDDAGRILGVVTIGGPEDDQLRWIGPGGASTVLVAGRFVGSILVGSRSLHATKGPDGVLLELALPWL